MTTRSESMSRPAPPPAPYAITSAIKPDPDHRPNRGIMQALSPQPGDRQLGRSVTPPDGDARTLTDVELDGLIRAGWDM